MGQNEDNTEYDAHNRRLGVVASATHATPRTRISESIASGLSVNEMMRGFSPQRFSSPSPKRERERERDRNLRNGVEVEADGVKAAAARCAIAFSPLSRTGRQAGRHRARRLSKLEGEFFTLEFSFEEIAAPRQLHRCSLSKLASRLSSHGLFCPFCLP